MSERKEALMRIVIGVASGLILGLWKVLVQIVTIINFIMTLITGDRNKGLAEFCETWNTQAYIFLRYMTFVQNKRPFPFEPIGKEISHFED